MIFGVGWGLRFPDICLTVEKKSHEETQAGKLTQLGVEPRPARQVATMLPLDHSGGLPRSSTVYSQKPFLHFTYVTNHSPTLPSLYLHHSSFSNPSIRSPTSEFILQPFFCFSYVTSSSLNSPGELPKGISKLKCKYCNNWVAT